MRRASKKSMTRLLFFMPAAVSRFSPSPASPWQERGIRRLTVQAWQNASPATSPLGLVIISGVARGVDTASHGGAISAKGKMLGVFGAGVDVIYPKENSRLSE
jgi:DNA recombination-mediator protein A